MINKWNTDFSRSVFFGLFSLVFGLIQFEIPDVIGGRTSLNEVPLLISLFYFRNPLYIIVMTLIASATTPTEGYYWSTFISHIFGLLIFWYSYQFLLSKGESQKRLVQVFFLMLNTFFFYLAVVIPLITLTTIWFSHQGTFMEMYYAITFSAYFEILVTCLIVTLFYLQMKSNLLLKSHLSHLEERVQERTDELNKTVLKLNMVNEELKSINESLDSMVLNRTEELEKRNSQLSGYAFINSHLLRAPLARILGLSELIRKEICVTDDIQLMEKFILSCEELDKIVKLLSETLTEESVLSNDQLIQLQDEIKHIAIKIRNGK